MYVLHFLNNFVFIKKNKLIFINFNSIINAYKFILIK
jgi:hypothetical protein